MLKEADDRRRSQRYKGKNYPLSVNGLGGSLIDWSAGGLSIFVGDNIDKFNKGEDVSLSVKSEDGHDVLSFDVLVLRTHPERKSISVKFRQDYAQDQLFAIIGFISDVTD